MAQSEKIQKLQSIFNASKMIVRINVDNRFDAARVAKVKKKGGGAETLEKYMHDWFKRVQIPHLNGLIERGEIVNPSTQVINGEIGIWVGKETGQPDIILVFQASFSWDTSILGTYKLADFIAG
jgi:hypothetical protein